MHLQIVKKEVQWWQNVIAEVQTFAVWIKNPLIKVNWFINFILMKQQFLRSFKAELVIDT